MIAEHSSAPRDLMGGGVGESRAAAWIAVGSTKEVELNVLIV
jgi:hypothetical protein